MPQGFDQNQNYYSFNNKNTIPTVFIHGVGLNNEMWKPQIDNLKEYSTITYDILGHGKTPFTKQRSH
jgi:Predicted hydrolases or acyltransferases (alpha/beta hydrolase superfamily)